MLVAVSHEGDTPLTLEAARAFDGPVWLVTAKPDSPLGELAAEVIVATPEIEKSWCHTASYTCAVATLGALRGEDVGGLPALVEQALEKREPVSAHERFLVAGAGRDWPTAQEAVLKLREGAYVAAEAHHTEQLLHGHLAAVDESVRAFVLEGEGRAAERAAGAAAALRELGCQTTLVPTVHPVADIVRFQQLTARPCRGARRRPGQDPPRRPALGARPRSLRLSGREQRSLALGREPGAVGRLRELERVAHRLLERPEGESRRDRA